MIVNFQFLKLRNQNLYIKENIDETVSIMRKSVGQRIPEKEIANFQFGELRKSEFDEVSNYGCMQFY